MPNFYSVLNGSVRDSGIRTASLRRFLIRQGIKEARCEECKLALWNGKKIPLQLHHVDGDNTNNILSNLQLLCPNCHAQTEGWSKNIKKTAPVSDTVLFEKLVEHRGKILPTILSAGLTYTRKTRHRIHEIAERNQTSCDTIRMHGHTLEPRVNLSLLWE